MTTNPFWPAYPTDLFGPLVARADVRDAVKATLETWQENYLAEIRTRRGLDDTSLPSFQDWEVRPEYRTLPESESPACMVTCPGTIRAPSRDGEGVYRVHFGVQVSVVVWGDDWEPTEDKTGYYSSAVIAALLQHPTLTGLSSSVLWLGSRYGEVEHSSTRTLGAEQINFDVEVGSVVNSYAGPAEPNDPTTPLPLVETASVTVIKEPLT